MPFSSHSSKFPAIVRAAQSLDCATAARRYAAMGLSVLPLWGKQPALPTWKPYQLTPASKQTIADWTSAGLFGNVGLVCGVGGLVVLDLDGEAAYTALRAAFPDLTDTYTVMTGSGVGRHVYLFVDPLPRTTRALQTQLGNVELLAAGFQIAAPPSTHPDTHRKYVVSIPTTIQLARTLDPLIDWIEQLCASPSIRNVQRDPGEPQSPRQVDPDLVAAISAHFLRAGYRRKGAWLNGPCIYPERHANRDAHRSFGFNTRTGYGYCFVCGSMLAKEIAARLDISPPTTVDRRNRRRNP